MYRLILLCLAVSILYSDVQAQNPPSSLPVSESIQQSKTQEPVDSVSTVPPLETDVRSIITIPSGTQIDVESAYTVSSLDVKTGELLSFRVLIPLTINGVVVIDKGSLVTARVTRAKRGGHWGKSGHLSWAMVDVIAVDNTRIPLAPETTMRSSDWVAMKPNDKKNSENPGGEGSVKGTGHEGEIATKTIIAAALFPPLAPLALLQGFKRGENAVLAEGKRFVVTVRQDTKLEMKGPVR